MGDENVPPGRLSAMATLHKVSEVCCYETILLHTQLYFTKLAAKHRKHRKQTNSKTQQKSEQTK